MFKAICGLLFTSMAFLATSGAGREQTCCRTETAGTVSGGQPLSVMTYNIKGLPWPVALGRSEALEQIADRLLQLRREGRQPHIVLLQEAFSSEAMALATRAGYPHAAIGPDASARNIVMGDAGDTAYMRQARWDRGEQLGKASGSGLMVLSDYPISRVDRMAFPDFACAGFDCLANKGVLIVRVDVPGAGPARIVNTHLNARTAAGVPIARSQRAYARQVQLMARFVAKRVRPGEMLILGGDMNMGSDLQRQAAFFGAFAASGLSFVAPGLGGAPMMIRRMPPGADRRDLMRATGRGKDWLFARDVGGRPLPVMGAEVPFGAEATGEPLSDHYGYVINYAATSAGSHEAIHFAGRGSLPAATGAR